MGCKSGAVQVLKLSKSTGETLTSVRWKRESRQEPPCSIWRRRRRQRGKAAWRQRADVSNLWHTLPGKHTCHYYFSNFLPA